MTHAWWWLVVDALAVYRLAVLVGKDKITDRYREALARAGWYEDQAHRLLPHRGRRAAAARWLHELVTCPWCAGIWFSAAIVALTRLVPSVWQYPAMFLAIGAAAGFLGERTHH